MYLRDCKDTKDFEKEFLTPFVKMEINEYKRKLIWKFVEKYWYENEYYEFINNFEFEKYDM